MRLRLVLTTVFLGSIMAPPLAAQAQTDDTTSTRGQLETVTVSARKKKEELQKTPLAVSAFSQRTISNQFASSIAEFAKYSPNIILTANPYTGNGIVMSIRGVSFADLEKTFEPSLGIYIDGVVFGTNTGALIDTFDVESIEILRGPQGTLYGRNTVGGVINVRRTRPTGEFGGKVGIRLGSYGRVDLRAVFNAPIVKDKIAFKLAAFRNTGNSHTRNIHNGERDGGRDQVHVYGALLFTPSDNFEALFTAEYLEDHSEFSSALNLTQPSGFNEMGPIVANFCDFGIFGVFGPPLGEAVCRSASFDIAEATGFRISTNDPNTPHQSFLEQLSLTLEMNWDLGNLTVTSITGYRDADDLLDEDNIGAPFLGVPVFRAIRPQTYEQFTQEIRVASNYDGRFNFQTGVYYFHSDYTLAPSEGFVFGQLASLTRSGQDSESYAIFGEGYYAITDQLNFTGGLRWTHEKKVFFVKDLLELDPDGPGPGVPLDVVDATESWSEPTWRVSLDYAFTDKVMGYVSYNRGFRSGGWNGRAVENGTEGPYDPEKVDSYEIGVRADLFNNHLRLNLTTFFVQYNNKQEEIITAGIVPGTTATTVINASEAEMYGLELEFTGIISERFSVRGSGSYQHSKYTSFLVPNPADPMGDLIDNTDSVFRWSPKWTANINAQYVFPVGNGGEILLGGNLAYKTAIQTSPLIDPFGRSTVPSTTIVDFSVTYDAPVSGDVANVRITAFLKDAFHKDNRFGAAVDAGVFFFGVSAPGRVWGLELEADF